MVPAATGTTLTVAARAAGSGTPYRAYVANAFGGVYSEPATLTVTTAAAPPAPGQGGDGTGQTAAPAVAGPATSAVRSAPLAATGGTPVVARLAGLLLLALGVAAVALARRAGPED